MIFNSLEYLVLMLVALTTYWSVPARGRLWVLLAASIVFYASWSVPYLGLIAFSTGIDYLVSLGITASADPVRRKRLLALAVSCNLAILCGFKYVGFFGGEIAKGLTALGWHVSAPVIAVALPLGISFYTFEAISYVID